MNTTDRTLDEALEALRYPHTREDALDTILDLYAAERARRGQDGEEEREILLSIAGQNWKYGDYPTRQDQYQWIAATALLTLRPTK